MAFLTFDRNWPSCKSYSLCMGYGLCEMARFSKLSHFSNIWCFFGQFFAQNNSNNLVERFFACLWQFKFLTETDHFAKVIAYAWAIAFKRWPIFKIVSFLEYLVFFFQRFFEQNNFNNLLEWFSHVFGIFNF